MFYCKKGKIFIGIRRDEEPSYISFSIYVSVSVISVFILTCFLANVLFILKINKNEIFKLKKKHYIPERMYDCLPVGREISRSLPLSFFVSRD
jgi:hypothetical protein